MDWLPLYRLALHGQWLSKTQCDSRSFTEGMPFLIDNRGLIDLKRASSHSRVILLNSSSPHNSKQKPVPIRMAVPCALMPMWSLARLGKDIRPLESQPIGFHGMRNDLAPS